MEVIAQGAAEAIIGSLILGIAIVVVAAVALRALPPGKAAFRFAVWFSALGAVGVVPLLQAILRSSSAQVESAGAGNGLVVLPSHWALYFLCSWAVIALAGLVRVGVGAWNLHRLKSASTVISPAQLSSGAREAVLRAAHVRAFELRASEQVRVPMAIGFLRPAILVPKYLLEELSPVQLTQVLLHETTHLLRYDDWTNLLQKIVRALLFFHPAVWWLESKLTLEREIACDEAVVAQTADPRSYAECLALLAEKSFLRRGLALVQTAVSRLQHTTLRVRELLVPGRNKTVHAWAPAAGVLGVVVCSALLVQVPEFVRFQEPTSAETTMAESIPPVLTAAATVPGQVVPAMFHQNDKSLPRSNDRASAMAGRPSAKAVPPRSRRVVEHDAQRVLASHRSDERVPVVVTTTMIVESSVGPAVPEQVWRMWRVTVYYPAAEANVPAVPRKT